MLTLDQHMQLKEYENVREVSIKEAPVYCHDFTKHVMAMQNPLNDVIESGAYPYNADVAKQARTYKEFAAWDEPTMNHFVYQAQHYRRDRELYNYVIQLKAKLATEGYQPITEDQFNNLAGTHKYVEIYTERGGGKYIKVRLIKDAEGTFFWVQPKFTRRGYHAQPGDYVKGLTQAPQAKTIEARNDQRSVATAANLLF